MATRAGSSLLALGFAIALVGAAKLAIVLIGAGSSTTVLLVLVAFFVERRERCREALVGHGCDLPRLPDVTARPEP